MKNKKIIIPALVMAFLLAGAGTIFVLKQIKQSDSGEAQQSEETAAAEDQSQDKKVESEGEEKEEAQKKQTAEEQNKQQVELIRSCNKIIEEKNVELRKEDQRYSDSLQKVNPYNCEGECLTRESVDKTHTDNINKINTAYTEKFKKAGCKGSI